ncbi:MAG: ABC transporter permease [Firmicutes bacterium HGW-Firmicutes-1]|nr:MAG: ABC transporter permease [Firmicutes bacterium HGW-Firmicutes-1]
MILYYGITIKNIDGSIALSFSNLKKVFEPVYLKAMTRSMIYAGSSTIICLILAYPLALILSKNNSSKSSILFLFILPMWMNFLLRTYAWMSLLETNNGFLNTLLKYIHLPTIQIMNTKYAIILGMVYNFLPFMVLPIYNVLVKIDKSVLEAASDLGANSLLRFRKVILPLSIPGIVSGISMVFMPAVTSFVIPNLLGGGKINLIGNLIEQQFMQSYNWYFGSSLSLILMIIILISMSIVSKFESEDKGVALW